MPNFPNTTPYKKNQGRTLGKFGKTHSFFIDICARKLFIMAKKQELQKTAAAPEEAQGGNAVGTTTNRDAYSKMFAEDYPDVDFNDKEARYGKMLDDRKRLRSYQQSGKALTGVFDHNRGLAAMVAAAAEGTDPFVWARENLGMDFKQALEDEEYAEQYAEALKTFQQRQVEGEEREAQRTENLQRSMEALQALQDETGISDDECQQLWEQFWGDIVAKALEGEVAKETFAAMRRAATYDADIAAAREQGGMQARNEKMQNRVRQFDNQPLPPTLSQGGATAVQQKPKRRPSTSMSLEEMKEWGY